MVRVALHISIEMVSTLRRSSLPARLGSRSYRDLIEHDYFKGISWSAVGASDFVLKDKQIENKLEAKQGAELKANQKKKTRKRIVKLSDMEVGSHSVALNQLGIKNDKPIKPDSRFA